MELIKSMEVIHRNSKKLEDYLKVKLLSS